MPDFAFILPFFKQISFTGTSSQSKISTLCFRTLMLSLWFFLAFFLFHHFLNFELHLIVNLLLFFLLQFLLFHLHNFKITLASSSFRSFKLNFVISSPSFRVSFYFSLVMYENYLPPSSGWIVFSLLDLDWSIVRNCSKFMTFLVLASLFLWLICGKCSDFLIWSRSTTLSSFSSSYYNFSILEFFNSLLFVMVLSFTH